MTEVMSVPELVMNALLPLMVQRSVGQHRFGPGRAGVGAAAGLGQAERAERTALGKLGQPR